MTSSPKPAPRRLWSWKWAVIGAAAGALLAAIAALVVGARSGPTLLADPTLDASQRATILAEGVSTTVGCGPIFLLVAVPLGAATAGIAAPHARARRDRTRRR